MIGRRLTDLLERRFREAHAGEPDDDPVGNWCMPIVFVAIFLCIGAASAGISAAVGLGDPYEMAPLYAGMFTVMIMAGKPRVRFHPPIRYRWAAIAGVGVLFAVPFAAKPWMTADQVRSGPVRFAVFLFAAVSAAYTCAVAIRLARRRRAAVVGPGAEQADGG